MCTRLRTHCLACALLAVFASPAISGDQPAAKTTRVPAWDARGLGPLPWQGIACLDVSADGQRIIVGTIAPPGDRNVAVLDEQGRVVDQYSAGQRWVGDVAWGGQASGAFALSTMPDGRAGDFPLVYHCGPQVLPVTASLGEAGWPVTIFHYGDHSNHSGTILRSFVQGNETGAVALVGDQVVWLSNNAEPAPTTKFARPADAVSVSLTVAPNGEAIVGCATSVPAAGDAPTNLFVLKRGMKQPLWSRPAEVEVDASPALEKGEYGTPTLPDGSHGPLPQRDEKVFAPLSTAAYANDAAGEPAAAVQLIATADYQGWQRWIRSSATGQEQNYSTRFVPTRPTVSVYDRDGKIVRRFAAELFGRAQWLDLKFLPGGRKIVACPHPTAARGLAGRPFLPADDDARWLYLLDIDSGKVEEFAFPDAISGVAVTRAGRVAVACWDGRVYFDWKNGQPLTGVDVGGPALPGTSRDAEQVIVATAAGVVSGYDGAGKQQFKTDLNLVLPHGEKPWVAKATAQLIAPGLWNLPGGRVESDGGGQRVIQAPDGLILIEAHAGLSFEREWAAIEAAGLDPRQVKYVLPTHEHGDHSPGAYLWRVVTGAQFVCSREMAYTLRHHAPFCSGYGFHPPNPTDIIIDADTELDLAGLRVVALRLPGHTFGSMGWLFEKGGQRFAAIGDLIMPEGSLGYAGTVNFSASDVLRSLRKLDGLRVDSVLPGHGPIGDPNRYIAAGISVGRHVGWGKIRPEDPDPRFRLKQDNVLVVAWNIDATSADFGDVNGDGRPDVAVATPADGASPGKGSTATGTTLKVYLNKEGKFATQPDFEIAVPQVSKCRKLRMRQLNDDRVPDFMLSGIGTALLMSRGPAPQYDVILLEANEGHQIHRVELGDGKTAMVMGRTFGSFQTVSLIGDERRRLQALKPEVSGPYADLHELDVNGDGRSDWLTSSGQVYLRASDGGIPLQPSQTLPPIDSKEWPFLAVGDFNADHRADAASLTFGMKSVRGAVFLNTGQSNQPFPATATAMLDFSSDAAYGKKSQHYLVRDTPTVADFNADGIDDLIAGMGGDNRILILFGGQDGLSTERSRMIELGYRLHFDTGLHVADFNGDGRADLATFGYTQTGVGASGPLGVYLYCQ